MNSRTVFSGTGLCDLRCLLPMATLILILFSSQIPLAKGAPDPPSNIHLTWDRDDTAHTISITWRTSMGVSGDIVRYDTAARGGIIDLYRHFASGVNHSLPEAGGFIHDVVLRNLEPDTTYYFICGGEGGWSEERVFKTAPIVRSTIRFAAGGDSRTDHETRDAVSRAMREFSPGFVLFNGDMVEDGREQGLWDNFFGHMDAHWTGVDGLTIPIVPALGNHERNATNYYEQLSLPGNDRWYSLDWGPDVHVIVLDSEEDLDGLQAQAAWLEDDLEAHASYPWKFVVFHRNVFKNTHEAWLPAFNLWVPLFDRYGVDIVFNGHSHNYMRSRPVNWTASTTEPQPSYLEGTMYVVAGAWGAPLYEPVGGWWVEEMSMTAHFVLVDLYTNGSLHLQAIDVEGKTFDEAWIDKPLPDSEELLAQRLYFLSREMDAKIGEISELGSQVESLSVDLNEERNDLAAAKSDLEATIEALSAQFTSEKAQLEEQIGELKAETLDLEARVRELESQPAPEDGSAQTTLLTVGLIASILISAYLYYLLLKSGRAS
jgi:hypothetical protein